PVAVVLIVLQAGLSFAREPVVKSKIPDADLLRQAETDFLKGKELADKPAEAQKHFAAAARQFDELRKRGASNPDLYRNLGNAEMLAGNLAGAVLAYRQGLRLAGQDSRLQANLEYARGRVHYPPSGRPPEWIWLPPGFVLLCLALVLYTL